MSEEGTEKVLQDFLPTIHDNVEQEAVDHIDAQENLSAPER